MRYKLYFWNQCYHAYILRSNNLTFGNKVVDQKSGISVHFLHFQANNCIFVKSTKLFGPISHLIFITSGNQDLQLGTGKIQFCDDKFLHFFSHFQNFEGLQLTWYEVHFRKTCIFGIGKHNLQHGSGIFEFCDILFWTLVGPTIGICTCCLEIPWSSNGGKPAGLCLFAPARNG